MLFCGGKRYSGNPLEDTSANTELKRHDSTRHSFSGGSLRCRKILHLSTLYLSQREWCRSS
jgi:hypothetical protein